jgi:hypothetical protein
VAPDGPIPLGAVDGEAAGVRLQPLAEVLPERVAGEMPVGRIRRTRSSRVRRVIAQSPRAGVVKRRSFPVKLIVGRR